MTTFSLKPGMQQQLVLFTDSPDEGDPDCICSYCGEIIEEDEIALRMFVEASEKYPHGAEYRLHWKCAGIAIDFSIDDIALIDPRPEGSHDESEDPAEYGPCCACGQDGTKENPVRNIVMIEKKASVPGTGWGCVVCHLPFDGASAIVCDRCLASNVEIRFAVDGYLLEKKRVPISQLQGEHKHDMHYHPEEG